MTALARFFIALALVMSASPAVAEIRYAVTLAGFPLMDLRLDLHDRGNTYRVNVTARSDGASGFVARLRGEDADAGRSYRFEIDAADWRQQTIVETGPGATPRRTDPAPRPGATMATTGAVDPMMALVAALRAAGEARCPDDLTVFDGWRNITVRFTRNEVAGDELVCRFTTDAATAGDDPINRLLGAGEARFVDAGDGRADIDSVRIGPRFIGVSVRRIGPRPSDSDNPPVEKDSRHDRLRL